MNEEENGEICSLFFLPYIKQKLYNKYYSPVYTGNLENCGDTYE